MVIMASVPTFVLAAAAELFLPEEWYSWILPVGFLATAVLLFFPTKARTFVRFTLPRIRTSGRRVLLRV